MYKTKIDNLDLKQIADSGQCFRWKNTGENEYTVVAFDRALRIKQDGNEFELDCDEADWNNIWKSVSGYGYGLCRDCKTYSRRR